ncbi:MAG TPA: hypothetical protein VLS27_00965 [Gammaproteobacteria bacterium]|nr:hypothetical protein [Gammaproteobacteria bacterium]
MKPGHSVLALLLSAAAFALYVYPVAGRANGEIHYGEPVDVGRGTIRAYLALDAAAKPVELGILMTAGAFEGLPAGHSTTGRCFDLNGNGRIDDSGECEGDYEYALALPSAAASRGDLPFQWIAVDWNGQGHAPPGIYDLPHFDFHFYIDDQSAVRAIKTGSCGIFIDCDDFKRATRPVPARYVDARHVNVDAAVGAMGNHLIDSTSREFAKPPRKFTHTWIFGAYDGRITFYEPMITREFFMTRPNMCAAIKQPSAWQIGGYYPTRYCIRYHPRADKYTVSLEGLEYRKAE